MSLSNCLKKSGKNFKPAEAIALRAAAAKLTAGGMDRAAAEIAAVEAALAEAQAEHREVIDAVFAELPSLAERFDSEAAAKPVASEPIVNPNETAKVDNSATSETKTPADLIQKPKNAPEAFSRPSLEPVKVDPDSLSKEVLSKMDRALKAQGYDSRGADDVREMLKTRIAPDGVITFPDWISAYHKATESRSARQANQQQAAFQKEQAKNVDWDRAKALGTTNDMREAGYITPTGSLIDMSGKREGGTPGTRALDHREVGGTGGMQEFMALGNIRMDANSGMMDIAKEPTPQQYRRIAAFAALKDGEVVIDLEEGLGEHRGEDNQGSGYYLRADRAFSREYPKFTKAERIIADIRRFFAGEEPADLPVRFKRGPQSGLPASEIESALAPALAKLKIPATVWDSVQAAHEATGVDIPDDARAMYHNGEVHLFAPNLANPLVAEQTLFHEVLHAGLHRLYGIGSKAYTNALTKLAAQNANIRKAAAQWRQQYGKDALKRAKQYGMNDEVAGRYVTLQSFDEALADLSGANAKISGLSHFLAAVQKFLRSIGLERLADAMESASDAEALALIAQARNAVMRENTHIAVGEAAAAYARRIFNGYRTARDFIVPETPQYEGNMTGDLATVPEGATKRGIEALPIRLSAGVSYEAHFGYGMMHMKDNADNAANREPPAATQDRAENFARHVVDVLRDARQIYTEGAGKVIFRSVNMRQAVVAARKEDGGGAYYSVITVLPSVKPAWGNPVWSGRLTFPDSSRGNSEPPVQSAGQSTTTTDPDRAEVQTEKFDFTTKQPTIQYKGRKPGPAEFSRPKDLSELPPLSQVERGEWANLEMGNLQGELSGHQYEKLLWFRDRDAEERKPQFGLPAMLKPQAFSRPTALASVLHSPKVAGFMDAIASSPASFGVFRGVNTQYHKAVTLARKGKPQFKAVFDKMQDYLNDINAIAVSAEQKAPAIFRELTGISPKSFWTYFKGAAKESDIKAIGPWLNQGTLYGGASPMDGIVWTDKELQGDFTGSMRVKPKVAPLTAEQVPLYHQARAAIAESIENGAKSIIYRHVKKYGVTFDKMDGLGTAIGEVRAQLGEIKLQMESQKDIATADADAKFAASETASKAAKASPKDRQARVAAEDAKAAYELAQKSLETIQAKIDAIESLLGTQDAPGTIAGIQKQANGLISHGYMPLKRFGNRTVTAKDKDGKTRFFGAYDGTPLIPGSANMEMARVAREIKALHPEWTVKVGVRDESSWKMYEGLSLDALENFIDFLDPETKASLNRDAVIQEYLANAVNNHSVMKELMHRKGTPGFSADVSRILASFVTSHARNASGMYHIAEAKALVQEIPQEQGDVRGEAADLIEYVTTPGEEATKLRGFLFFHFLGGSVAAAAVNLTQTVMMTAPYLNQFASVKEVTDQILAAGKQAVMDPTTIKGGVGDALQRAEREGITAPQQIHHLMATASNNPFSSNRHFRGFMSVWGGMFGAAEVFNRRIAFMSAYEIAKSNGMDGAAAYDFAKTAVIETQGIYNKGNRPNWSRGTGGALIFTFKTFSIMYLELLKRLPPKQQLIMLGTLALMAGGEGLPFEEDIADLIDVLGQWLGFSTNTGKWTGKVIRETLGKDFERPLLKGLGGMLPLDLHSRLGMANLLPGTAFFKPSEVNKGRDVAEAVGPLGGVVNSFMDSLALLARGKWDLAAVGVAPKAVRDIYNGVTMAATGESKDSKGRLAMKDVTAVEGFGKMTGFNPQRAAIEGEFKREEMLDKNLRTVRMDEIASDWADGILRQDTEKRQDAMGRMRQWNINNPEAKINPAQMLRSVQERVKSARMTGKDRFLKSLPKPMRAAALDSQ